MSMIIYSSYVYFLALVQCFHELIDMWHGHCLDTAIMLSFARLESSECSMSFYYFSKRDCDEYQKRTYSLYEQLLRSFYLVINYESQLTVYKRGDDLSRKLRCFHFFHFQQESKRTGIVNYCLFTVDNYLCNVPREFTSYSKFFVELNLICPAFFM